jgi:hypothetical protein
MTDHLGLAPDHYRSGTINSSRKVVLSQDEILEALTSGGQLRGMYSPGGATDFELLTGRQVEIERKGKFMEIGRFPHVPQSAVRSLAEKGLITIPQSEGRNNRVARALLQPTLRLVSG